MIVASSINNKILITIEDPSHQRYRLERRDFNNEAYLIYTSEGFVENRDDIMPLAVNGDVLDNGNLTAGLLYSYRYVDFEAKTPRAEDYVYSNWVRNGGGEAVGYTFGNYKAPDGQWGTIATPDDVRFTYLWGTDFKANNGQSYTDAQIQYFIDASTEEIGRKLDITIKKTKVRYNAQERGFIKGLEYDDSESPYSFRYSRIARYGLIKTRQKPICKLHNLTLLSRFTGAKDLTSTTIVDKNKGLLKLMERPVRPSDTSSNISASIGMYGTETLSPQLFYTIDYDAGFETSDDVPADLRQVIAKNCAVSLLNIIGDGLMSGFSSSSLSMDGLSESFSSTQSATSAYFGARIKEYKDDISDYIKENKHKFGSISIGAL